MIPISHQESVVPEKPEEVKEEKKTGSLDKRIYFRCGYWRS